MLNYVGFSWFTLICVDFLVQGPIGVPAASRSKSLSWRGPQQGWSSCWAAAPVLEVLERLLGHRWNPLCVKLA